MLKTSTRGLIHGFRRTGVPRGKDLRVKRKVRKRFAHTVKSALKGKTPTERKKVRHAVAGMTPTQFHKWHDKGRGRRFDR